MLSLSKHNIFFFVTLLVVCFAPLGTLHAETAHDKVSFVVSDSEVPPDNNANWQPITLPDAWSQAQQQQGTNVWYRIQTYLKSEPRENWAFLLERINMNAAVFLGKQFLGNGGTFEEPMARNWVRPLLFQVPSSLLNKGENIIYVRVLAYPLRGGGFKSYQFSPNDSLIETYQALYFHYITSSQLICFSLITFACLLLLFWFAKRQHTEYLWLATAALSGAMFPANMCVQNIPVAKDLWVWAVQVGIGWFVWSILITFHRYFNIHKPWLEKTVAAYAILGSIIIFFVPNSIHQQTILIWQTAFIFLATYIFILTIYEWHKHRDLLHLGWVLGYSMMYLTGVHDWSLIIATQGYFFKIYYHYGTFILIVLAAFVMLSRFTQSLKETEQLNHELRNKIDHFEAAQQQRCAVNNERQRIMRDLHDGLGNTLVSAIALSKGDQNQQSELQTTLKNAMAEMRLIVDSEIHTGFSFEKILNLVKKQSELIILGSGIQINWDIKALFATKAVHDPDMGLHVIRILQEALSNAIKHANASTINIEATLKNDSLLLNVSDNGRNSTLSKKGHGLRNMQARANQIHASLSITNSVTGTIVSLALPLKNT